MPYASRSNRLLGQFLDGVVGAAPIVVGAILGMIIPVLGTLILIAGCAWSLYYYLFADGFEGGQSFAKRWLGMRVVDADTGAPCTFWQSFIRNFLLMFLGPIDWIFIFGDRHQRLGDKAANTVVLGD